MPNECDIKVDGASTALGCSGLAGGSERVLLPCGADARLPTIVLIERVRSE